MSTRFVIVALAFAGMSVACSDAGVSSHPDSPSDEEIADLRYMREEEKLARDVYVTLYAKWELQILSNIASSEQTHTDAVASTMERLDIEDPVVDDSVGVFVNANLADLYETMVSDGFVSRVAALYVGATIEEIDMIDIQKALERTDEPGIVSLYESLLCGSRNHLRSFTSELENAGYPYIAQFLDPADLEAIVTSPRERCGSA